jgi:hypothetical protein
MDEQFRQMNLNESNISVTTNTSQLNSSMSDPYYQQQQQQQQLSPNNTSQQNLNGVGVGAGVLSHEAVSVSLVSEQRETTPIPSQQPPQQPPSQHIVMNLSETGQQPFIIPSQSNAVGGGFEAAAQQTTGGELVAATQAALSSSEQPPEDDDENDESRININLKLY